MDDSSTLETLKKYNIPMYFSELERKISVRSTRDELIKKGVIKERVDDAIIEANENQSNATTTTTIQADTTTTATSPDTTVVTAQHNHAPCITETGELSPLITPGRRQSKRLSTIDKRGSKIDRNSVFDCHLSPVWRQMAIKNSVLTIFDLRS